MVGGRCERMRGALSEAMAEAGIPVRAPREGLDGRHRRNICNRGRCGTGGQLELSEGLRARFREDPTLQARFVQAVRKVLLPLEELLTETGSGEGKRDLAEKGGNP